MEKTEANLVGGPHDGERWCLPGSATTIKVRGYTTPLYINDLSKRDEPLPLSDGFYIKDPNHSSNFLWEGWA